MFRLFDGLKPFPIDYVDKKYKNTFGILLDDVLAGIYVVLCLYYSWLGRPSFLMNKLNEKIVRLLRKKNLKLSIAESCTGGKLSSAITSVSGSSKIFTVGIVTYSNQSKIDLLKVPKQIIKKHGAVSIQCCFAMANNLIKISKSNISISVTGIAGPKGGSKNKPIGLVYIGIKMGNKVNINRYFFKKKGRLNIQKAAVRKSLELILNTI